jgi:hypothetical protein
VTAGRKGICEATAAAEDPYVLCPSFVVDEAGDVDIDHTSVNLFRVILRHTSLPTLSPYIKKLSNG